MSNVTSVATTDAAVLRGLVSELTAEDASKDLAANKDKVARAGSERETTNKRVREMMEEARELQKEADRLAKEAEGSNFFEKIIGKAADKAEQAAKAANKAEHAAATAEEAMVKAKQASEKAKDALEVMQNTLKAMEQAKDDVDNMRNTANQVGSDLRR